MILDPVGMWRLVAFSYSFSQLHFRKKFTVIVYFTVDGTNETKNGVDQGEGIGIIKLMEKLLKM